MRKAVGRLEDSWSMTGEWLKVGWRVKDWLRMGGRLLWDGRSAGSNPVPLFLSREELGLENV